MTASVAPLVIGIGNPERGDDSSGLAVVERLQALPQQPLRTLRLSGDTTRLLDLWGDADCVVLVDMVLCADWPAGSLRRFDLSRRPLPYGVSCSSHGVSISQVVELGRVLGRLPPRLELLGIVGTTTTLGADPSPEVAAAVERAALKLVETWCQP